MFTGIIEEVGKLKRLSKGGKESRIEISCKNILSDLHIGDSIAVNGVCLTVVSFTENSFTADVMNETFHRTNLGQLKTSESVNLERAMAANGRFGGHIVSGHIDGQGIIKSIKPDSNAIWFEIKTEKKILDYIVEKGSIAIDGISLTVARVDASSFYVSIIPHTLSETVLGHKKIGDSVNLENDMVGKYIKSFCENREKGKGLTKEFLLVNGY